MLCKIPSDKNARNIALYCEFSNTMLGHTIRTLPGMDEKRHSYIFTSGSRPHKKTTGINRYIQFLFVSFVVSASGLILVSLEFVFEEVGTGTAVV